MRPAILSFLSALMLLFPAAPLHASPIRINIISATYSIRGHAVDWEHYREIAMTQSLPMSGTVAVPNAGGWARADTFAVSTFTYSRGWEMESLMETNTEILFSPLMDTAADLSATVWARDSMEEYFLDGRSDFSLFDVTDGRLIWSPGEWESDSDFLFDGHWSGTLSTTLSATHLYRLQLSAWSYAEGGMASEARAQIDGLQRVSDPGSTLLLFGIGLVGLRAWRKR